MLKIILKSLICKHAYNKIRTIHGDEIIRMNARSEWKCGKCGWVT